MNDWFQNYILIGSILVGIFIVPVMIWAIYTSSKNSKEKKPKTVHQEMMNSIRSRHMTDQGKFGYPYCPVCNKKLKMGFDLDDTNIVQCTQCGTKVTVVVGAFNNKITHWEPPESPEEPLTRLQYESIPQTSPLQEKAIFCTKCGQKLPIDSRFCNTCGTELPDMAP